MTTDQVWKILLVEDSEDDYILTRAMLNDVKAGGYAMVWADRYAQALEVLQSFQPDVALLDYNLGQYNGVDLLYEIRERGYRFPVILLTGRASYAIDLKAMQAGVADFIEKDQMTGATLERAIRYTIEQEQIRTRLEQMNEELEARVQERTCALMESNQALAEANAALAAANTELRNREALLEQAAARMAAQVEISAKIAAARLNVRATLNILAYEIAERIGDVCVIALLSEDGQTLSPLAFHHSSPEGLAFITELLSSSPNMFEQSFVGQVARSGQALLLPDFASSRTAGQVHPHFRPYINRFGVNSLLIVPLRVQGRVIGTIGVSRDQPDRPYTMEDQLFLQSLADRTGLGIDNARLYETVQKELAERQRVEAELSEIQSRLIDGAEAERLQLARELHDGPIQDLYAIALQLRFLEDSDLEAQKKSSLDSLQESIQRVTDTLRAAAVALRPPALTRFGLEPAIRSYCDQFHNVQPGLAIYTDMISNNGQPAPMLSERINLALFRVLQMALTNVARHARATQVAIRLRVEETQVWMEVEDNGIGFQVPSRWVELARQGHLGLVGAIERAEALGGKMTVFSHPGQGTTIRVTLPRTA